MENDKSVVRSGRKGTRLALIALGFIVVIGGVAGLALAGGAGRAMLGMHCGAGGHAGVVRDFVAFRIEKALDRVNATPEQKQKIAAILDRAKAQHDSHAAECQKLHDQAVAALTAESVDRAALESVRTQAVACLEKGSTQLVDVIVEVAQVLTPEQRRQLAELAKGCDK